MIIVKHIGVFFQVILDRCIEYSGREIDKDYKVKYFYPVCISSCISLQLNPPKNLLHLIYSLSLDKVTYHFELLDSHPDLHEDYYGPLVRIGGHREIIP